MGTAAELRVVELTGEVVLDGPLEYGPDVLLRVAPGTVLRAASARQDGDAPVLVATGGLQIAGLPGAPVRFQVPLVVRSPGSVVIEHATFEAGEQQGCQLTVAAAEAHLRHVTTEGGDTGLCVERGPPGHRETAQPVSDAPSPGHVIVEDLRVSGAGVGVHLAEDAPTVRIANSTVAGNGVGLRADGGHAVLDHVTFADNREWDIQAASARNVEWSGSRVAAPCVNIAGRTTGACERGSLPLGALLLLLGLLVLLSEAGRYALTRFAMWVGLYSRIPKADLPKHPVRAKLLDLVSQTPGIHMRALVAQVGGYGRTSYHMERLEQGGFVTSRRDGLHRRFYPQGHAANARAAPTTRERILAAIAAEPGIHPGGLAERLGLSRQLAAYHVAQLAAAGLVLAESQDRRIALRAAASSEAIHPTGLARQG